MESFDFEPYFAHELVDIDRRIRTISSILSLGEYYLIYVAVFNLTKQIRQLNLPDY